jgi:hypothetical protein
LRPPLGNSHANIGFCIAANLRNNATHWLFVLLEHAPEKHALGLDPMGGRGLSEAIMLHARSRARYRFNLKPSRAREQKQKPSGASALVAEHAEDRIVRNLVETVHRLHADLDRIEFWTAALAAFQATVPPYQPGDDYLLPPRQR